MEAAPRIERVVVGVIRQALEDARATTVTIEGKDPAAALLGTWCQRGLQPYAVGANGLVADPACKTQLLLGDVPPADILPFGDVYHSELTILAPGAALPPGIAAICAECGGVAGVDRALALFYDQRLPWARSVLHLDPHQAARLSEALDSGRFRRSRLGLVPKLGARTLGVDLYA